MTDSFDPVHAVPRFLAEQAPQEAESAVDGAVTRSRVFRAGIVISAVTATGIAILAMGNPAALFAHLSASLVDDAPPPSTPTIQSAADAPVSIPPVADAQGLPPATTEVPARSEIAAPEPAKDQTEKSEATSETLFKQFQTWAAEQDANGVPAQPVQGAAAQVEQKVPAPAAENARAPQRLVQKRRPVRTVRNARAEVRAQAPRKPIRRPPAQRPPVQDARAQAQDQAVQNAQAPSFLPTFGQRN